MDNCRSKLCEEISGALLELVIQYGQSTVKDLLQFDITKKLLETWSLMFRSSYDAEIDWNAVILNMQNTGSVHINQSAPHVMNTIITPVTHSKQLKHIEYIHVLEIDLRLNICKILKGKQSFVSVEEILSDGQLKQRVSMICKALKCQNFEWLDFLGKRNAHMFDVLWQGETLSFKVKRFEKTRLEPEKTFFARKRKILDDEGAKRKLQKLPENSAEEHLVKEVVDSITEIVMNAQGATHLKKLIKNKSIVILQKTWQLLTGKTVSWNEVLGNISKEGLLEVNYPNYNLMDTKFTPNLNVNSEAYNENRASNTVNVRFQKSLLRLYLCQKLLARGNEPINTEEMMTQKNISQIMDILSVTEGFKWETFFHQNEGLFEFSQSGDGNFVFKLKDDIRCDNHQADDELCENITVEEYQQTNRLLSNNQNYLKNSDLPLRNISHLGNISGSTEMINVLGNSEHNRSTELDLRQMLKSNTGIWNISVNSEVVDEKTETSNYGCITERYMESVGSNSSAPNSQLHVANLPLQKLSESRFSTEEEKHEDVLWVGEKSSTQFQCSFGNVPASESRPRASKMSIWSWKRTQTTIVPGSHSSLGLYTKKNFPVRVSHFDDWSSRQQIFYGDMEIFDDVDNADEQAEAGQREVMKICRKPHHNQPQRDKEASHTKVVEHGQTVPHKESVTDRDFKVEHRDTCIKKDKEPAPAQKDAAVGRFTHLKQQWSTPADDTSKANNIAQLKNKQPLENKKVRSEIHTKGTRALTGNKSPVVRNDVANLTDGLIVEIGSAIGYAAKRMKLTTPTKLWVLLEEQSVKMVLNIWNRFTAGRTFPISDVMRVLSRKSYLKVCPRSQTMSLKRITSDPGERFNMEFLYSELLMKCQLLVFMLEHHTKQIHVAKLPHEFGAKVRHLNMILAEQGKMFNWFVFLCRNNHLFNYFGSHEDLTIYLLPF